MGIKLLDKQVINKISAGEVVEKPASIVKELVENSIDAGATSITIDIEKGGISKIIVQDDGCGIKRDEVILAFTPHATSKLQKIEDLDDLLTMGFRGEALATISAISRVTMITKTQGDDSGLKITLEGGEEIERCDIASTTGTKIEVRDVFYNTPARLKFLRKPKSEEGDITTYVEKLMLSNPHIAFKYIVDGKIIYNTAINGSVIDNIYTIYGKDVSNNLIEVDYQIGNYRLNGYISKPEFGRSNRTYQNLFVNGRYCNNQTVSVAIQNAYDDFTMKGKFPLFVLFLNLPQNELDVNVHPNKLEVKFSDSRKVFQLCNDATYKALFDFNHIRKVDDVKEETPLNVTYANVSNEGISYENKADKLSSSPIAENKDEQVLDKDCSSYFNKTQTGSFGFELSNNVYSPILENKANLSAFVDGSKTKNTNMENDYILQEVELESINVSTNENNLSDNKILVQEDYKNLFKENYTVVGKIFNTYLILEYEDKVYFIDQHAAHERARYDALIKEVEDCSIKTQSLLVQYTFNVSSNEANFITENIELLNSFGLEIYEFGEHTFKISAVPMILAQMDIKKFVDDMLKNITGLVKSPREIIKERFMQMACKSAVKGGDDLSDFEIRSLLETLRDNTKVLLCPHGRPIVVDIDKKQIDKWFKRIV